MNKNNHQPKHRLVWAYALFLSLIALVIVAGRTVFLVPVLQGTYVATPPKPGIPHFPEAGFVNHAWLTLAHILPGLLFVVMGLLQFVKRIRSTYPVFHRWNGRFLFSLGLVIGITGIVMGFRMAISGVAETAATTFFGVFFLFALVRAFTLARQRNFTLHRVWMIRAFAVGLAVTTTRPIVGIFFATGPLTGLTPEDFFGTALWIGFTLHLIGAEVWLNRTRAV